MYIFMMFVQAEIDGMDPDEKGKIFLFMRPYFLTLNVWIDHFFANFQYFWKGIQITDLFYFMILNWLSLYIYCFLKLTDSTIPVASMKPSHEPSGR